MCDSRRLRLKDITNTCKRVRSDLSIGGTSSVQKRKIRRSLRLQICYCSLLCNKIKVDQLQCVICCVLSNPYGKAVFVRISDEYAANILRTALFIVIVRYIFTSCREYPANKVGLTEK